jgi:hypothetical protein
VDIGLLQAGWFWTCTAQAPRPTSFPVKWLGYGINKQPLSSTEVKETELSCAPAVGIYGLFRENLALFHLYCLTFQYAYCGLQQ